ncbi:MAG TPA: hypothetical protein VKF32_13565, partial [Thermoanaerobaculia bacterium]|nr:hypothetical protein [Thermoanaerobaculia bacterium]
INKPTEDRLPTVSDLDFRIAKDIKIASLGVTLSIDIFNVLNRNSTLQRNADVGATVNTNGGDIYETQAPRVVRFGGRVSF